MTTETQKPDFRLPTVSKWSAPHAVADGGGGTIIATATTRAQKHGLISAGNSTMSCRFLPQRLPPQKHLLEMSYISSEHKTLVQSLDYAYNLISRMRYQPDHKARTHRRIVKNAARRFRAEGLSGPGVATVMKASGLTVGGFYKHFRSKDELLAEAIEEGFLEHGEKFLAALEGVPPADRWKGIVRHYLSPEHCEHPEAGCPIAALAPEIARARPAVRKRIATLMKARRQRIMQFMPGENDAERERNFNIIFPAMAGAVSVARMLPYPKEREKILHALRDHLLASF